MAELKTKPRKASVMKLLDQIADEKRRKDSKALLKLMKEAAKAKPQMWGTSIIGKIVPLLVLTARY